MSAVIIFSNQQQEDMMSKKIDADDLMDLLKDVIETIVSDPLIALRVIGGLSLLAEGAYEDGPDRASAIDELTDEITEEMTDRWAKRGGVR